MKQLGVIANTTKERAPDVLRRLVSRARKLGMELCGEAATAALAPDLAVVADEAGFDRVDAIIALGGDGTMLRAVRAVGDRDIPLIGVNIGSLGFMTSVAEADLDRALDCLARDEFAFSHRAVADCSVLRGGVAAARFSGLNDVVVSSGASSRVVTLNVSVNGDRVASYVCDGLIVSTPTGSTGHNLSAGGPIVVPETRAFVISLICPHTLSSRPLVVPDSSVIVIEAGRVTELGVQLSVDGQVGQRLSAGESARITARPRGVRFIHLPGYNYYGVLSQKLGWKART